MKLFYWTDVVRLYHDYLSHLSDKGKGNIVTVL
jgi:hypothetical protein